MDTYETPINLVNEFRDTEVVAFLFGSSWSKGKPGEFYKDIIEFTRRHPHRFKCIYVSIDTDSTGFKQNTSNKPWLAMVWNDGSNLPISNHEDADEPIGPLAGSEDFLLAGEEDLESDLAEEDTTGKVYTRPFARVHLASKLGVLGVPTLVVYSLTQKKVLNYNVRPDLLLPERAETTWEAWHRGESADLSFTELLHKMRWTIVLLIFAIIYSLSVKLGGEDYNFLARWVLALAPKVA